MPKPISAKYSWLLILAVVAVLGLHSDALGQRLPLDRSAVTRTAVPHRGHVRSAPPTSRGSRIPAVPVTFAGSPYSVGPVITPTSTGPQAEEHIAADPKSFMTLVSVISDFSRPLDGFLVNTTKFAASSDNGSTWSERFVPLSASGLPVTSDGKTWDANSDPVVAIDNFGNVFSSNLYINFISQSNDGLYVNKGTLSGNTLTITATNPVATNSPSSPNFEDKEWLTVDNSTSSFNGNVYVCWTRFTASSDHIRFSRSTDHGNSWQRSLQVSPASQNGAVQGCQVAVGPSGEIYVAWEVFYINGLRQHFITKSTDGGVTFGSTNAITPPFREVNFHSSYRKNSFPALDVSPVNGDVVDVFSAFTAPGGTKVLFTRSADGGNSFSYPATVVDAFQGDQFFPAVDFDPNGTLHVSWFDTRNSGRLHAAAFDVYATFSTDNGNTFAPNTRVTPSLVFAGKRNPFIGDYSGIAAAGGFAHPVWNSGGFVSLDTFLQTATLTLP